MGSKLGIAAAKLAAVVVDALDPELFDQRELVALDYADAMTIGDVSDDLFKRVTAEFDEEQIVELTEVIAWENASARFNRALRVPSDNLWDGP